MRYALNQEYNKKIEYSTIQAAIAQKNRILQYKLSLCKQIKDNEAKKISNKSMQNISQSIYYPIDVPKRVELRKKLTANLQMQERAELEKQIKEKEVKKLHAIAEKTTEKMHSLELSQQFNEEIEDHKAYKSNKM